MSFALVTLWIGNSTKHSVVNLDTVRSMIDAQPHEHNAPFPLVHVVTDSGPVQFVGTLNDFIPLLGAANYSNGVPEMTAQQLAEAKVNGEKMEAEKKAKEQADREAEIRSQVNAALYPNGVPVPGQPTAELQATYASIDRAIPAAQPGHPAHWPVDGGPADPQPV